MLGNVMFLLFNEEDVGLKIEVKWIMLDHLKKIIKSLDSLPTFLNLFKNQIIAHRYMVLFLGPTSYYQFCLY